MGTQPFRRSFNFNPMPIYRKDRTRNKKSFYLLDFLETTINSIIVKFQYRNWFSHNRNYQRMMFHYCNPGYRDTYSMSFLDKYAHPFDKFYHRLHMNSALLFSLDLNLKKEKRKKFQHLKCVFNIPRKIYVSIRTTQ